MPQVVLENISISFSDKPILHEINASIYKGDKIAIIGRNGEGKSTLMKIIAEMLTPNDGDLKIQHSVRINYLEQTVPNQSSDTVFDIVASGLEHGDVISNYQRAIEQSDLMTMQTCQELLERYQMWDSLHTLNTMISKFGLTANAKLSELSGGWRRRVLLLKSIISDPDILLLDEPTNHMDIDAILELERMLKDTPKTLVMISHDRSFVANVASKIFDLDRGSLTVFDCGYRSYLTRKDELLHAEEVANKKFDKKLSEEEAWIRQGIKARRKRNEGRVRALMEMRKTVANRREIKGKVNITTIQDEKKFSKVVFEVKKIDYAIAGKQLITNFSTLIMKGDKIGIIGGNGVGKSTLIKLLLGELTPDSGNIRKAKDLKMAYFAQIAPQLNTEMLAKDFVADEAEYINVGGRNVHVIGYLRNFLFTGKQALAPIKMLSGGERNRLTLAKILAKPANILILDEPTNDLDVETLELLEDMLSDYEGTLIIISHDREFLDNVVHSTIVMDGQSIVRYTGGYQDYLGALTASQHTKNNHKSMPNTPTKGKIDKEKQKELKSTLKEIEKCETKLEDLKLKASYEEFYTTDTYLQDLEYIKELEIHIKELYTKWETLDNG